MAIATLAIAGCSQNEIMEKKADADKSIGFNVYTGVQTRGKETDLDALKQSSAGFGFLAYRTSGEWSSTGSNATPDFLYNEHGKWTAGAPGSWGYDNTRFWPTNSDKISFFAYAPYQDQTTAGDKSITLSAKTEKGAPTLEFALASDVKNMVDLVTDCRTDIRDLTAASNSGSGIVSFKFSHVLTKVADIKVKTDKSLGNDIKIFVKELKLTPGSSVLQNKAKYQFTDDQWVAAASGASYYSAAIDLASILNKTNANFAGYTTSSVDVSSTTAVSLFSAGEALYFIPVNNTTGTAQKGDLKLNIKYDVVMKTGDNTNTTSETAKEVELPQYTFKKGNAYTYTLNIKLNTISISVDETAMGWTGSDTNTDIDVK